MERIDLATGAVASSVAKDFSASELKIYGEWTAARGLAIYPDAATAIPSLSTPVLVLLLAGLAA